MAIREGKWRCTYCSSVNRGSDLACAGCGATREKDVQFFLEDEAPEVTAEAELARAQEGADWLCQFCGTSNRHVEPKCGNCGAERGAAKSRPVMDVRPAAPPPPAPAKGGCCGPRLIAFALLLLLMLGFCAYRANRKTTETVRVAGFEWTRSIVIEERRAVREEAWEGEVPAAARVLSRSREIHHQDRVQTGTRRVKVGTRDLGNGYFEDVYENQPVYRETPVYKTKIRYEIERWVEARTEVARGGGQDAAWPRLALSGRQREGKREEHYVVLLQGTTEYRMELPAPRWQGLEAGRRYEATVRGGSRVEDLQ